jgi:hypothetical protein
MYVQYVCICRDGPYMPLRVFKNYMYIEETELCQVLRVQVCSVQCASRM